jgi:hypothetical protein
MAKQGRQETNAGFRVTRQLTRARRPAAPRPDGAAVAARAEHGAGAAVEALRLAMLVVLVGAAVGVRARGDEPRAERWRGCRHCPFAPSGGGARHPLAAWRIPRTEKGARGAGIPRGNRGRRVRPGRTSEAARDAGARARDWRKPTARGGAGSGTAISRGERVDYPAYRGGGSRHWPVLEASEVWSGGWLWCGVPEEEEEGGGWGV